jgi:large subunit ribosomal protein L31
MHVAARFLVVRRDRRRTSMAKHPNLNLVDVRCSTCGTTFSLKSTAAAISADVCSHCHPAYTGQERALASGSRIERFNRRRALAAA